MSDLNNLQVLYDIAKAPLIEFTDDRCMFLYPQGSDCYQFNRDGKSWSRRLVVVTQDNDVKVRINMEPYTHHDTAEAGCKETFTLHPGLVSPYILPPYPFTGEQSLSGWRSSNLIFDGTALMGVMDSTFLSWASDVYRIQMLVPEDIYESVLWILEVVINSFQPKVSS